MSGIPPIELIAVAGPRAGERFALPDAGGSLGRDASCWICLADTAVSRRHATLAVTDGTLVVEDHGSLNGTRVNGVPQRRAVLVHGDQLGLGGSLFVVRLEGDRPAPKPPLATHARLAQTERLPLADAAIQTATPRIDGTVERSLAAACRALLELAGEASDVELADVAARWLEHVATLLPARHATLWLAADNELRRIVERPPREGSTAAPNGEPEPADLAAWAASDAVQLLAKSVPPSTDAIAPAAPPGEHWLLIPIAEPGCSPSPRHPSTGLLLLRGLDPAPATLELAAAIAIALGRAVANQRAVAALRAERSSLLQQLAGPLRLLGDAPAMVAVRERVARVGRSDATVLVLGESGTGKELVARAIHATSRRARGPLVALNCAAIAESLLESELFGHERGAFTGAVASKRGKLELADGGTLFLDEVGELSPALQAKLLRALQEREVERVGGGRPIAVDVRVVAATHRDLGAMVAAGQFRADLLYRLDVVRIELPPLRQRREDVPLLAHAFLAELAPRCGRPIRGLRPSTLAALLAHDWPGNVRQLRNAVEHALVLGDGPWVELMDLPESVREALPDPPAGEGVDDELATAGTAPDEAVDREPTTRFHAAVRAAKRSLVAQALAAADGNVTAAARELGLHPNYLHRLLNQLGLR